MQETLLWFPIGEENKKPGPLQFSSKKWLREQSHSHCLWNSDGYMGYFQIFRDSELLTTNE